MTDHLTAELPHIGSDVPAQAEADAWAAEATRLPGADRLLSAEALSELLGRQTTISHLRIKPGHSVVVAHRDALGNHGWAMLTDDADKHRKALLHAEKVGRQVRVHQDDGPYLVSGEVWSDPVLAKELAAAHRALAEDRGTDPQLQILRYNPRRRVVARTGDEVVRVHADPIEQLPKIMRRWRDLDLPVTKPHRIGKRRTAVMNPLWGELDLTADPQPRAAETAGAAMGRLHELTLGDPAHALPPSRQAHDAARAVGIFAPWLTGRAARTAERIQQRFASSRAAASAEVHGDLSPDQVVLGARGSHKIRLIDLDRAGLGEPAQDLGSWAAACRRLHLPQLAEPFMRGYADARPAGADPMRVRLWEAHSHLTAALEPFRRQEHDWPAAVTRRLELAEETCP